MALTTSVYLQSPEYRGKKIALRPRLFLILAAFILFVSGQLAFSQQYGTRLGVQRGGEVTFEPQGTGVIFGALDPAIRKWYIPQELYNEYQWRQWEYSNYAREPYQRYVNTALEGDYFYDFYGNYVTRGWLLYDWRQDQPQPLGSSVFKDGRFNEWFNNLTVSSDAQGQFSYAITVGNQIRTTLTPMTFSKPLLMGCRWIFLPINTRLQLSHHASATLPTESPFNHKKDPILPVFWEVD